MLHPQAMFAHNLAIITTYQVVNLGNASGGRILNGQHAIFNLALLHRHRYLFKMSIVNLYLGPSGKIFFQRLMTIRTADTLVPYPDGLGLLLSFLNMPGQQLYFQFPALRHHVLHDIFYRLAIQGLLHPCRHLRQDLLFPFRIQHRQLVGFFIGRHFKHCVQPLFQSLGQSCIQLVNHSADSF